MKKVAVFVEGQGEQVFVRVYAICIHKPIVKYPLVLLTIMLCNNLLKVLNTALRQ